MRDEQKDILIAKMIDAPSSLSDDDLDMILHDDELRELYEASAAVRSAYVSKPELDMKAEWDYFRPRIRRKPSAMRWVSRVAAIFLGVGVVSWVIGEIIDKVFTPDSQPVIAKVEHRVPVMENPIPQQMPRASVAEETESQKKKVTSEKQNPPHRNHSNKVEGAKSKTVPAPADSDINIDEYLRVQQAQIDNELAVMTAEIYMERYNDLVAIMDATGTHHPELDNMIRKITME